MHRITNCMLIVNVTSPVTELPHMIARFGFIEADRHLVAMVVATNSTTGIEILMKLKSILDFHFFGHVALPIQYLNRAMVTAKRSKEEVSYDGSHLVFLRPFFYNSAFGSTMSTMSTR